MKRFLICAMSVLALQLSVPPPAYAVSRPSYPPQKCWDAVAKLTIDIEYAEEGIKEWSGTKTNFYWAVHRCRKNDFITVANAYRSNYRTLADYVYYDGPESILLKGDDANTFRLYVCRWAKKYSRQENWDYSPLACK